MTQLEFIEKIAPLCVKFAKKYGYKVASPAIAQACLESGYGTSEKAKHHNYFGLKYRANRVTFFTVLNATLSALKNTHSRRTQITAFLGVFRVRGYNFILLSRLRAAEGVLRGHTGHCRVCLAKCLRAGEIISFHGTKYTRKNVFAVERK